MLGKEMVSLEQGLHGETGFQMIASQDKEQGFTGGNELPDCAAADAAKFGKVAVKCFVFGKEDVE
jgi:hypothetical protein